MEFILKYKKMLIGGVIVLLIGSSYLFSFEKKDNDKNDELLVTERESDDLEEEPKETFLVDIKGAVNSPGVKEAKKGMVVYDIILLADGLKENADTSVINLSKKAFDEMVIVVYTNDEIRKMMEQDIVIKYVEKECVCEKLQNDACIDNNDSNQPGSQKISINTANVEGLTNIPGIGESKAISIIDYREKNGKFKKIEDIMNVSGIGEATFDKIKDYITV